MIKVSVSIINMDDEEENFDASDYKHQKPEFSHYQSRGQSQGSSKTKYEAILIFNPQLSDNEMLAFANKFKDHDLKIVIDKKCFRLRKSTIKTQLGSLKVIIINEN